MSEPTIIATTYTLNSTKLNAKQITGIRWAFGIGGILTVALGIFLLAAPKASLIAVAWIFAIYFIIAGVFRIARGIAAKEHGTGWRVFSTILGVLLVVGGIYVFAQPAVGILALGLTIGITWIIEGVAALFDASPDSSRWFAVLYAIISIVGGVFVLVWPASAIIALLWFTAFFLIAAGIVEIVQAFTFGRTKAAKLA